MHAGKYWETLLAAWLERDALSIQNHLSVQFNNRLLTKPGQLIKD